MSLRRLMLALCLLTLSACATYPDISQSRSPCRMEPGGWCGFLRNGAVDVWPYAVASANAYTGDDDVFTDLGPVLAERTGHRADAATFGMLDEPAVVFTRRPALGHVVEGRPVVGQQARISLGSDFQQEVDLGSLFKDAAGYVQTLMAPAQARHVIDRAVRIPPGLVVGHDPELDAKRFRRSEGGVCLIPQPMIDALEG